MYYVCILQYSVACYKMNCMAQRYSNSMKFLCRIELRHLRFDSCFQLVLKLSISILPTGAMIDSAPNTHVRLMTNREMNIAI